MRRRPMAKRLNKRTSTAGKRKEVEAPEPETQTEKGATNVAEKTAPLLGRCIECSLNPSNSESDHLCYGCHVLAKFGSVFDAEKNRYIVPKRRK
jgi:hypothetical protein